MKKSVFTILLSLGFCFALSLPVLASSNNLPDMMVGQTTVTDESDYIYYGGMTGNYAVLNFDKSSTVGFNTSYLKLTEPANVCLSSSLFCFVLGSGQNGSASVATNTLMNSKTYVNGSTVAAYELPALFFGGVNVIGDAYGDNLSNFAFWGRTLAQNYAGTVDNDTATWQVGNYIINAAAQSTWGSNDTAEFLAKIDALKGEAQVVDISNTTPNLEYSNGTMFLQSNNINTGANDTAKYPEGKTWRTQSSEADSKQNLEIANSIDYSGIGTVIVTGDLVIDQNMKITTSDSNSHLGFIVYGNVTIGSGAEVHAPIISINGNITVQSGAALFGSYVAKNFVTGSSSIRIIYDYNLDNGWPPGFRYLKMPTPKEIGNQ